MCDNRTSEFLALAKGLPTGETSSSAAMIQQPPKKSTKPAASQELRDFHTTAGGISRDIAATSALLTELTDLVRHGGGAGFDPQQQQPRMNQLVVRIKSSIENLNSRLDQANRIIQQQKRRVGQQAGQEAANMVNGLQTEFAAAASDFKRVLQERTDTMKEQTDFQKQVYDYGTSGDDDDDDDDNPMPNMSLSAAPPVYSSSSAFASGVAGDHHHHHNNNNNNAFPTLDLTSGLMSPGEATGALPRPHGIDTYGASGGGGTNSALRQRNLQHSYSGSSYGNPNSGNAPPLTPLDIQRAEEEMGQQMQLIPDQDYLQQRADAMSTVETNIVELGTIFNKLAVMVNEHREMVQRVDDNVQDANTNINMSLNVLTDTLTSLRTNRMLALRVFSVLVLFIIGFIIFFA